MTPSRRQLRILSKLAIAGLDNRISNVFPEGSTQPQSPNDKVSPTGRKTLRPEIRSPGGLKKCAIASASDQTRIFTLPRNQPRLYIQPPRRVKGGNRRRLPRASCQCEHDASGATIGYGS